MPTINYITPISTTNGNFKQSNCMDQGFCIEFDQNIGVSCDDNDICTSNDKIQTDCTCQGIFMDEDNDGTCDAKDICLKAQNLVVAAMTMIYVQSMTKSKQTAHVAAFSWMKTMMVLAMPRISALKVQNLVVAAMI
ncbi:MAG: hypothetical protein IPJ39_10875 [Saprospiraceae bacterium]|nr:hypothetical protein [Saprospiraceae bacterium]